MKCGNCRWYSDWMWYGHCENPDSKHCGDYVSKSDYCRKWAKKEEKNS